MVLDYKDWQLNMHKLFTVCTEQVRSPYTEHAVSGLPNPTHLEGAGYDLTTFKTSRWLPQVTECLLTRSMLIKMYVYAIYSRFCIGTICLSESMNVSLSLQYNYRV